MPSRFGRFPGPGMARAFVPLGGSGWMLPPARPAAASAYVYVDA